MKKIILFPLLFMFLEISAQPFIPMISQDHIWSVDIYHNPFDPGCEICDCCSYTITEQISIGETVTVNSNTYRRVLRNSEGTSCLIREENGIVYKYSEDTENEVVFYDYTLEVGNIFNLPDLPDTSYCSWDGENNSIMQMEVTSVSVQNIAGENRKVIEFDHFNELGIRATWIEGIGSVLGFDPISETIDITFGTALVCFTDNTDTYFFNNATSCDNTTLNVSDFELPEVVLYPNPVTNQSVLQFSLEGLFDMVRIVDVQGKLIKEEIIVNNTMILDAMDYPSGLYFYQVFSENRLLKADKFIVR